MRKTTALTILLIVFISAFGFSEDRLICDNANMFYALWKDAAFGKNPNRTERAAWFVLNVDGSYGLQPWPVSAARNSETWKGPVPDAAFAIVHTHSASVDQKPSREDVMIAQRLKMKLYVISRIGIWSVNEYGRLTKEVGEDWSRKCRLKPAVVKGKIKGYPPFA